MAKATGAGKNPAILFTPTEGKHASLKTEKGGWKDVMVHGFRRGNAIVSFINHKNVERFSTPLSTLDFPLNPDVNDRFKQFEALTSLVLQRKLKSLFVSGEGGVGKDYTINQMIVAEELELDKDYVKVKGFISPFALFNFLKEHHDKVVVLSDCDSAFEDKQAANILKAVLDTYDERKVDWFSKKDITNSFVFTGSVVFLSNKNVEDVESAILSRSVIIDLFMTPEEKIARMRHILPVIEAAPTLTMEEKDEVLDLLEYYKDTLGNLNIRTLVKGLIIYEQTRDLQLVRYQVINS